MQLYRHLWCTVNSPSFKFPSGGCWRDIHNNTGFSWNHLRKDSSTQLKLKGHIWNQEELYNCRWEYVDIYFGSKFSDIVNWFVKNLGKDLLFLWEYTSLHPGNQKFHQHCWLKSQFAYFVNSPLGHCSPNHILWKNQMPSYLLESIIDLFHIFHKGVTFGKASEISRFVLSNFSWVREIRRILKPFRANSQE